MTYLAQNHASTPIAFNGASACVEEEKELIRNDWISSWILAKEVMHTKKKSGNGQESGRDRRILVI